MHSKATTVEKYLAELPADRRAAIEEVRKVILDNLDPNFKEGIQYGMIGYYVPHSLYPAGYHCDPKLPLGFACLASQKNHMALYMMCVYDCDGKLTEFREAWAKTGKKLDMGKSCIRFKKVDDLALDVIGAVIKRMTVPKYIAYYETALKDSRKASSKPVKKTAPSKKSATLKKAAKTKPTAKAARKKR